MIIEIILIWVICFITGWMTRDGIMDKDISYTLVGLGLWVAAVGTAVLWSITG